MCMRACMHACARVWFCSFFCSVFPLLFFLYTFQWFVFLCDDHGKLACCTKAKSSCSLHQFHGLCIQLWCMFVHTSDVTFVGQSHTADDVVCRTRLRQTVMTTWTISPLTTVYTDLCDYCLHCITYRVFWFCWLANRKVTWHENVQQLFTKSSVFWVWSNAQRNAK